MRIKQIFGKDVVKNTTTILSGNVIAQLIALAIYPLLTRIYSPDDFGVLTVFLSLGGIWVIIAGAEYYNAVMLPKSRERQVACFQVSLITIITVSVICAFTIFFKDTFARWYNSEELGEWYSLLPVYVLFSALWILLQHWYSREKQFKAISGYQIGLSSANAVMKSGFGFAGLTSGGMIWSMTIAPVITLIASVAIHLKKEIDNLLRFDWNEVRSAAKEYSNFPKYATPRMILNYAVGVLPVLALTPYFSVKEIGLYGLAVTLSQKPINICISSMYTVFFQKFSMMVNEKRQIVPTMKRYILLIISFVIPGFIILYFILPELVTLLLGKEWAFSAELIRAMLLCLATMFVTSTFNFIPDIFQKQKTTLLFEIINSALCIGTLFIGIYYNNFLLTIRILYNAYATVWIAEAIWIIHIAKEYDNSIISV